MVAGRFKVEYTEDIKKTCQEMFILKNLIEDVYEILSDGEANMHEDDPINNMLPDQYLAHLNGLIEAATKFANKAGKKADDMYRTKNNLIESRRVMNEKLLDVEMKLKDITDRHDRKTELNAKLHVKTFILYSEIERLNAQIGGK